MVVSGGGSGTRCFVGAKLHVLTKCGKGRGLSAVFSELTVTLVVAGWTLMVQGVIAKNVDERVNFWFCFFSFLDI